MAEFLVRTDEHRLLHETVTRVFADPQQLERTLAESGLLALPFASADGGLREDGCDDLTGLAIAFAAKGAAFGIDTFLFQAVLGGGLISGSALAAKALSQVEAPVAAPIVRGTQMAAQRGCLNHVTVNARMAAQRR